MEIIYALYLNRNGGKYVHSNEDFCKKCCGSQESRYMLLIFSKAGLKFIKPEVQKFLRTIRGQQCYVGVALHS